MSHCGSPNPHVLANEPLDVVKIILISIATPASIQAESSKARNRPTRPFCGRQSLSSSSTCKRPSCSASPCRPPWPARADEVIE